MRVDSSLLVFISALPPRIVTICFALIKEVQPQNRFYVRLCDTLVLVRCYNA